MKTRYFVKANNNQGPYGTIKEFKTYKEAAEFADNYNKALGVPTRIITK